MDVQEASNEYNKVVFAGETNAWFTYLDQNEIEALQSVKVVGAQSKVFKTKKRRKTIHETLFSRKRSSCFQQK